ncbi:LacI family DNA-binding transcriptional regulator [Phototrophicus methaneseepsis]|uniref:LacI family DNA-binding transcriptional regulator n=1 Tax=Phototrophicus methaneseepsis TaxID=2710758 RepID=A0A7S8E7Y2_9CHLR|nr:LacI family DNA-binding transcriptional regulator [Phototrophicus methaneseepsis]QPC82016.1 LacI family DNA-binding transcriptional regulator [Phototrophicus methaneseepsis]
MTPKKKTVTIRDVAKLANVSYQTVSLVINNKPGVSVKTRKRILRLMDELDYRPNHAAQMLTTNRSQTLELILVDIEHSGRLAESTKRMAHAAKQTGYNLLVSETTEEELGATLDSARARLVDGVVLYAPLLWMEDDVLEALSHDLPLVRRDYRPGSRLAWVGFDQVYAARLAVEHLIQLGHRQIAAIPPKTQILNGHWRYTAWENVIQENGLEPGPVAFGDYSMESGYQAALKLIQSGERFTAVVVGTDGMAMGALRGFRECGLNVPDDVSVVGFDNSELSRYTDPLLTTVEFKFIKQDELAVRYLVDLLTDPTMELHQRVLLPNLIVRDSTRQFESP